MKGRKIVKKLLKLKYIIALLIVIMLSITTIMFLKKDLISSALELNNKDFSYDGFESYADKLDDDLIENKIIGENNEFILFFNEKTTIATIAIKNSFTLPDGVSEEVAKRNPANYAIKYSSAKGTSGSDAANLLLTYTKIGAYSNANSDFDTYKNSVNYINELTKEAERYYSLKYLTKEEDEKQGVQILYTVGNFVTQGVYFSQNIYASLYRPSSDKYNSILEHQKAVEDWENNYLPTIGGSLKNTFEERFRGNTEIDAKMTDANGVTYKDFTGTIRIYDETANEYFLNIVVPYMNEHGYDYDAEANLKTDKITTDSIGNRYWEYLNLPEDLLYYRHELYQRFFNNSESPLTNNPFFLSTHYSNNLASTYTFSLTGNNKDIFFPYYYIKSSGVEPMKVNALYAMLYSEEQTKKLVTSGNLVYYRDDTPVYSGGFVATDNEGNYIYDSDGYVTRAVYNYDQVKFDNSLFGVETTGLAVFQICLEFLLTEDGLEVTILQDSILDATNIKKESEDHQYYKAINNGFQLLGVSVLPGFTNFSTDIEGQIIIPDGSGAYINYENDSVNGLNKAYSNYYYGSDLSHVNGTEIESPGNLLLGMYAMINTTESVRGGVLGVVEKGGGQVRITASANKVNNYAYFGAYLRATEEVRTGTAAVINRYTKFAKEICENDIQFKYIILDETENNYSAVAKRYQEYLIARDALEFKDQTDDAIVNLNFLGTFERYSMLLGIRYMSSDTLTSFEQAKEIIDDLKKGDDNFADLKNNPNYTEQIREPIKGISVAYTAWTNENLEYKVGGPLKVSKVLGGKVAMQDFYDYCYRNGIEFYPEMYIATTKGYDFSFGNVKYTTHSVGNLLAEHYPYDLSTHRQIKTLNPTYILAPQFYHSLSERLVKDFDKLKIWDKNNADFQSGYYLSDIGNSYAANYKNNNIIYPDTAIRLQQEALETLNQSANLKISAPYDYAFKYVSSAVNVPVAPSMYPAFDGYIPLYQLVVSGLFDYATEEINGLTSHKSDWYFVKAIETGSNLNFIISAEDPQVLLETDYTYYYNSYFINSRDKIFRYANTLDEIGIHKGNLISHEIIDNSICKVTYEDKTTKAKTIVYTNATDKEYIYVLPNSETIKIPGYGYQLG